MQMLFCEICKIFKNPYFAEHILRTVASAFHHMNFCTYFSIGSNLWFVKTVERRGSTRSSQQPILRKYLKFEIWYNGVQFGTIWGKKY